MFLKIFIQLTFFIFFLSFNLFANDIVIRNNNATTELKLNIPKKELLNYSQTNNMVLLSFKRNLKLSLDEKFNDKFISKIISEKNNIIIELKNNPNIFVKPTEKYILIIYSPKKKIKNIKLNSQIEKQIITKKNTFNKNPNAEKELSKINFLIEDGKEKKAIEQIKIFLNKYNKGYYAQEAMFKLGMAYMSMGKKSEKHYIEAAAIFEEFIKEYPDNYHVPDALWKSAEAKEKAGIYYESIFAYRKLMELVPDTEIGKMALERIGKIYFKIGQYDKAISVFKEYIDKYKTRPTKIIAYIGMAKTKIKDYPAAYLYFSEVYNKGIKYTSFSPDILFSMAETFEKNNKLQEAISIYSKIYNLYPKYKNADLAMYRAAMLIGEKGKTKLAKELLLGCREKYKGKKGALLSSLYIAEKEKNKYSTEYWIEFLQDVVSNDIDIELQTKAKLFIIESFYREKRYRNALEKITEFEKNHFDSALLNKAYAIKQKIYIEQAREAFKLAQLDKSDEIVTKLLKEFPNTKYLEEAEKILENNKYSRISKIYNQGNFLKTIKEIEKFYLSTKKVYFQDKWNKLLDNSYYEYIQKNKKLGNKDIVITFSRQYLIDLPNAKHSENIKKDLQKLIKDKIIDLVKQKYFIKAVKFYETNKVWVDKSKDLKLKDTIKSYVAYSLYKLGEDKSAIKIIQSIKNKTQKETSIIMFLLDIPGSNFNINNLSENELRFIVDELKYNKSMKILNELDKYTKNIVLRYQLKYDIIKTFKGKKLNDNLSVLYEEINLLSDKIKKEINNLFFDAGILFYEQKKYEKSYKALDEYLKLNTLNEDKLPKALYIAGVAAQKNGLIIKAKMYFNKLLKKYPNSEFTPYAKTALEDINWNEKLKK